MRTRLRLGRGLDEGETQAYKSGVTVYRFETGEPPLAAQRAAAAAGKVLDAPSFSRLTAQHKTRLIELGSQHVVDANEARGLLDGLALDSISPGESEPHFDLIQDAAHAAGWTLTPKVWEQLSALERYVLHRSRGNPAGFVDALAELVGARQLSTHLDAEGRANMVSVTHKATSARTAVAETWVRLSPAAFERLRTGKKGDVLAAARLAGIMATKKTHDLIPLCHPLSLSHAEIQIEEIATESRLHLTCRTTVVARTGVEMEAMTGVSVAALTVYDMLKGVDRSMEIGPTRLVEKRGGSSGDYQRSEGK